MSTRLTSIIIVTAGIKDYLKSCLDSIKKQSYSDLEIIIIDNSLNEDFSKEICRCYPGIKLYSNKQNLFYCQALNKGIEVSRGSLVLCLNDDIILDRRFIEEALKGFDIDKRIGMVSGKIFRRNAEFIDSTGLFLSVWRTAKERGYGLIYRGQYGKKGYIFGVNGAVAFYRRKMLEDIKLGSEYFDSDFHMFYEDLDIAWRAHNFGWKGYYLPSVIAYHIRGGTVRQDRGANKKFARRYLTDDLQIDLVKNRYLAIIKNESFLSFLLHLPFIIIYDIFVWGYILFFRPQLIKRIILSIRILMVSAFRKRMLLKRRYLI